MTVDTSTLDAGTRWDYETGREVVPDHFKPEAEGGLGHCTPEAPCRIVEYWQTRLAAIEGGARFEVASQETEPEHTGHRPEGGSVGANQYGTFTVRMPSDKQTAYVTSLLAKRALPADLTPLSVPTQALAAFQSGRANLRQTSDLITWLLTLPELPAAVAADVASDKQVALINKLMTEREVHGLPNVLDADAIAKLTKKQASGVIDQLFALPKKQHSAAVREAAGAAAKIESGLYEKDGVIYRVYFGQQSRQQLAKVYRDGDWAYAGKAERFVSAADAMSPERIKEFGAVITHTHCVMCGLSLDDPESVDRGIGPVCYGRLG